MATSIARGFIAKYILVIYLLAFTTASGSDIGNIGATRTTKATQDGNDNNDIRITTPPADLRSCPNLRIAVVNGVPYHHDVLAGLLHVLRPYAAHTDVYINRYTRASTSDGAWDLLKWSKSNFLLLTRGLLASLSRKPTFYDLVILVSPEYELDANAELLRHVRRRLTIAFVHNSDWDEQRLINVVKNGSTDGVRLVTLSPHTAGSLAATLAESRQQQQPSYPVDWQLAVLPFKPRSNCLEASEVDLLGRCLRGFSMQGKFSNLRRNYSAIWDQLLAHRRELTSGNAVHLFHLNLLGKGQDGRLNMPSELEKHVSLLRRLRYTSFYEAIHHTFALIPALASEKYYTVKFSSTILTSLVSGTPLIADKRFLSSYGMFSEDAVYLQHEGEQEVDVMLRVMLKTSVPELLGVRKALLGVRQRLNERAAAFYAEILSGLCKQSSSSGGVA
ncbi:hypothetical protein Agub_g3526 [Astrephomene gubernaculifera]|uniref:Uncharacterized protein n=1 Tax=Astrephomene gubernaculifera TaxID=47775 RepID=A0AAD3DIR1_9CHLO|nr:hypothetical protein Agub_g3526 [Astrephomene gubernaculifera]